MKHALVAIGLLLAVVASDAIASDGKPSSIAKSLTVKLPAAGAIANKGDYAVLDSSVLTLYRYPIARSNGHGKGQASTDSPDDGRAT